jgi:hypothetical protein
MRSNRLALFVPVVLAAMFVPGCTGNHSSDSVAPIFLSENIPAPVSTVNMSTAIDVVIPSMTINSQIKAAGTTGLSPQNDVTLTLWVITPSRVDGGTVASPQWRTAFASTYVPAGGSVTLSNVPIFPAEYFNQPPLNQLFPVNGGIDKETGKSSIRQRLQIEVFGKTVSGKSVSLTFDNDINFLVQ